MSDKILDEVEEVALEIVNEVRKLHFKEGTSTSMQTRKLKDIIEKNSKSVIKSAS